MVTVGTVNTVTAADSSLGYLSQLGLANVQPVSFRLQSVSNVLLESGCIRAQHPHTLPPWHCALLTNDAATRAYTQMLNVIIESIVRDLST